MRIVVIGSGPAGLYSAITSSSLGNKVTLVEKEDRLGGTCVLYGCIPSKAMLHPLILSSGIEKVKGNSKIEFNFKEISELGINAVNRVSKGTEYMLEKYNVDIIHGRAILKGNSVEVNGQTLSSDKIIIATGTVKPQVQGSIASDDLPYLDRDFQKVVIIGGGVGGVEYGWLLRALGKEIFVVEKENLLLPRHDPDLRNSVTYTFRKMGFSLLLGKEVKKIERNKVVLDDGKEIEGDIILMSFGRTANVNGFEGVPHDKWIKVNEFMETEIRGVYAAGDVTGSFTAHEAISKGITAGYNASGIASRYRSDGIVKVIYTKPQIAYVGDTTRGKCVKLNMASLTRAIAEKETEGFVKVCVEDDKVIGAVAFSERAEEIVSVLGLAIRYNIKVKELAEYPFPHPSYLETINEIMRELK
ncbi:FAD-dependent oxidoreductase [Sulfolobus acidocaldarius]|uniref:Dihydrolipoamide dehydrogenase n=4 Tax=Sulfolobus acidocaldarius TaxID=2285 RepID=Q4JCC0_SULAC|nr:NAD(P)/FAD-dependent oxidoreductase [Sulfolobus acidocaldarius]AAY79559.1 dihydrolipoamide dehydrogenase [Sulfolobus acidocaldarius DSM 639]AGE70110.1 dihydrolipoamide dehydrogenase [Sulfolobus acidocaldarius N8]AGE72385.1 dihydrolipoamide dehydrogenase [Sulfolobus acidocaldarius Ron12/I]ALU29474.1 pyridine nucleotide-disulfide oxidoreductase [Sulfolobus acidocaldarius]ALU32202.1 pyridine nucleotide-disulfide oxidoreductase [Sulfolobus acidocaldarius]